MASSSASVTNDVTADEPNFLMAPINIMIGYDYLVIGDEWSPKGVGK
jgi:hypothetical protein